ncbi:MAG: hypothetical protein CLLPBCKN_006843 [Chroococcidiopsis cubana SAG 39.79]|nr:hypothetical protein [Chroococcidiopsis cubana]MDZ4877408.1 hypothetical protein [Chroococcidiopsis cubana SAG 39.79]
MTLSQRDGQIAVWGSPLEVEDLAPQFHFESEPANLIMRNHN